MPTSKPIVKPVVKPIVKPTPTQTQLPSLPLHQNTTSVPFYVRRIICIGRNYAEHAKEMGHNPNEAPPFFFYKPLTALTHASHAIKLAIPSYTHNLHHELELSIAIGQAPTPDQPENAILGCGIALDMTCRDTQKNAKNAGRPWDTAKGFDGSAPCSALQSATWQSIQQAGEFTLTNNAQRVQTGHPKDMIWPIPSLIQKIQAYTQLDYGDLILTGTPAGVGQVNKGDTLQAAYPGMNVALTVDIT